MSRTVLSIALSDKAYKAVGALKDKAINISKYFEQALLLKFFEDFKNTTDKERSC